MNPNGVIEDDTQDFLVKIVKKICNQMTASSLIKVHKNVEKTLDLLCPEWRLLHQQKQLRKETNDATTN